jgi:hypothetical protein
VFKYKTTASVSGLYNVSGSAVSSFNPNNPAATGGGSLGYNANQHNY